MPIPVDRLKEIRDAFLDELTASSMGKKTSLPFILHELPHKNLDTSSFQVMSVGGTHFETADVIIQNGKINLQNYDKQRLPRLDTEQILYALITNNLHNTDRVALNFAYAIGPVIRDNRLDGTLIFPSKTHHMKGLVGQNVGQKIEKYISEHTNRDVAFSVANDTICLLLAGLENNSFNELVGGVVGTGMNFAFFLNENKAVNLESSHFDKFERTTESKLLDTQLPQAHIQPLEKEVAGAYLYHLYNERIKKELPSEKPITTTGDLNIIAQNEGLKGNIACEILEHSAALVAMQIAAIFAFKKQPLTFVMEGSLFWQAYHYQDIVNSYLLKLGLLPTDIKFIKIPYSNLVGAAHLV